MPNSNIPIAAPLREALIECFRATTRLKTEDVDVAAPPEVLLDIWEAITAGAPAFSFESDGRIAFDAPQGFRVRIDLIQFGEGSIERIHVAEPFFEGSVASKSDLLRLRAVTVVERGSDGEIDDFLWLLWKVAMEGRVLPELGDDDREYLCGAGEFCLGPLGRLVLAAILSANNAVAAGKMLI
ncbi:hypothetical protein F5Y04DRAFT_280903 [Hypomontagnella monticulosa]|nr:hypothetical protein F5Y04DRAFT_280903 [Hypomontagnella monticulosa]